MSAWRRWRRCPCRSDPQWGVGGNGMGHRVNKGVGGLYQLSDCFFLGGRVTPLEGRCQTILFGVLREAPSPWQRPGAAPTRPALPCRDSAPAGCAASPAPPPSPPRRGGSPGWQLIPPCQATPRREKAEAEGRRTKSGFIAGKAKERGPRLAFRRLHVTSTAPAPSSTSPPAGWRCGDASASQGMAQGAPTHRRCTRPSPPLSLPSLGVGKLR